MDDRRNGRTDDRTEWKYACMLIKAIVGCAGAYIGGKIGTSMAPHVVSESGVIRGCPSGYLEIGGVVGLAAGLLLAQCLTSFWRYFGNK
jgi:hypothetical protein